MEPIGKAIKSATALAPPSTSSTLPSMNKSPMNGEKLKLATYHARLIFGCYRADQFSDPEIFVTATATVLAGYPKEVGAQLSNPATGIASKFKWPPAIAEIREACEQMVAPTQRAQARQAAIAKQLQERDEWESAPRPKQSYEEFKIEMAERGMPIDHASRTFETVAAVKARFGISDEQWDAMKDLPKRTTDQNNERLR